MAAWLTLFEAALDIIAEAERLTGGTLDWTVGGGTMLYRRFRHRLSKDIAIFVTDPQVLGALSPRLNEAAARKTDGASYVEQSNFVRIMLPEGEIAFIVAPRLTKRSPFGAAPTLARTHRPDHVPRAPDPPERPMTQIPRALRLLAALMTLGFLAACDTTGGPQPVPDSASRHHYMDRFVPRP